eukprot:1153171-Pelagomonas_calceolata.AAC.10
MLTHPKGDTTYQVVAQGSAQILTPYISTNFSMSPPRQHFDTTYQVVAQSPAQILTDLVQCRAAQMYCISDLLNVQGRSRSPWVVGILILRRLRHSILILPSCSIQN